MPLDFEQGPIRPPSEAMSLLLRVTRNCPWNKCEFCPVYKEAPFSRRSVEEVKADIDIIKEMVDNIKQFSWQSGQGGAITRGVAGEICQNSRYPASYQSVAAWLYYGAKSAFLQDANTLIMQTAKLVEIVSYLKAAFPQIERITSYARSATLARKSVEELTELRQAGLNRIHVGLESGSDAVLKYVRKGSTAEQHINGGRNVIEAGIELSEYVMPGLGGANLSVEHAIETARVINAIDPTFIRIRSLIITGNIPLREKQEKGEFDRPTEVEMIKELRLFIETLDGINSTIVSDHMLNLLEDLNGKMPEDQENMLATLDEFLALPKDERDLFILGRRAGILRVVSDLSNPQIRHQAETVMARLRTESDQDIEVVVRSLAERFI